MISLIGPFIHVCCTLKRLLLDLEGNKYIFDSVFRPLIIQSPLPTDKNINFEDSDDSPIINCEPINLFCEEILFVYLFQMLHKVNYIIFTCIILYMYFVELIWILIHMCCHILAIWYHNVVYIGDFFWKSKLCSKFFTFSKPFYLCQYHNFRLEYINVEAESWLTSITCILLTI